MKRKTKESIIRWVNGLLNYKEEMDETTQTCVYHFEEIKALVSVPWNTPDDRWKTELQLIMYKRIIDSDFIHYESDKSDSKKRTIVASVKIAMS